MNTHRFTWFRICAALLAAPAIGACGDDASVADAGMSSASDAGQEGHDAARPAPDDGPRPNAEHVPSATGSCPAFAEGDGCEDDGTSLVCTFEPKGVPARKVRVWLGDETREGGGPLVFFWHGLSRMAADAVAPLAGLGPDVVDDILAAGGVLIAPEKEEGRETSFLMLPWISAAAGGFGEGDNKDDDFLLMDEILACAIDHLDVDLRRIYSTGISAGGLQTGQVVRRRSGYLASAVTFSGGMGGNPDDQDPDNQVPVAIFWGGPNDMVGINFQQSAYDLRERLDMHGQFSILCNHDMGHLVPVDAAKAAWRFMQDHPFGTAPSPYADSIPDSMPSYCELEPPPP